MAFNSQAIIQDIRTDFEKMLEYVTGEEARKATADATERGLFKMLIEMGLKLLTLFFEIRSQNANRENLRVPDGSVTYYHRDTPRKYVSIFGKLRFVRPYFIAVCRTNDMQTQYLNAKQSCCIVVLNEKRGFTMFKMIWGGLIVLLFTACDPAPIPVPPVEGKTAEPKFWQGFPVMPGGVEIDDDIAAYHYTVIADVDTVINFYREQMQNTEWELIGIGDTSMADEESAVMWFANNESTVSLQIWSKTVVTHVAFMIDSRYPTPLQ